jgi:hypothetical protein
MIAQIARLEGLTTRRNERRRLRLWFEDER